MAWQVQMDLDNGRCWKAPGESIVTEPSPLGLAVTWSHVWTKLFCVAGEHTQGLFMFVAEGVLNCLHTGAWEDPVLPGGHHCMGSG